MTDDTARYFNSLQHIMFLFILGELNETEGHLQFGYFASLEQFNIQLAHPGIIARAQWFDGRVWWILLCKVFICIYWELIFVLDAFSRSLNHRVVIDLFGVDMLHTSLLTQILLRTLRCCYYIGQVRLNHQVIVQVTFASGNSRWLLCSMNIFIHDYRVHYLSEIYSSWSMFNELLPVFRSVVHLSLLRSKPDDGGSQYWSCAGFNWCKIHILLSLPSRGKWRRLTKTASSYSPYFHHVTLCKLSWWIFIFIINWNEHWVHFLRGTSLLYPWPYLGRVAE